MSTPFHIALLECDELSGALAEEYGSIGKLYRDFFEEGAIQLEKSEILVRPDLYFTSYDVVHKQEYPSLEKVDAIFMTGSRHDAFTSGENDWILKLVQFIRTMLQEKSKVRIIAVCFGHQIVGRAYGVMPERHEAGWEVSVTPVVLTERGKDIFGKETLALHQMHRDALPRYPSAASVEAVGYSDQVEVQGMYVKNRILTLQGHPEYNAHIANDFLERRHGSVLDEETYQDGKERANDPQDGINVAARFLLFLLEG